MTCSVAYIGDERYNPLWEELNNRNAVVFLHGSQIPSTAPSPNALLGIPIVEVSTEDQIPFISLSHF